MTQIGVSLTFFHREVTEDPKMAAILLNSSLFRRRLRRQRFNNARNDTLEGLDDVEVSNNDKF